MSDAGDDGPGQREVAYRLFATVYDDADLEHSESDEERAPNYVITPTGARVNRLFVVGVLTEVEPVSDDVLRGRVVDPTGAFVCYAGQYQPDERAVLDRTEPPAFVAVTGKARTFQPDDGDRVFTSVRPESISAVDADARDRWTVDAAEATLDRVEAMATALALEATGEPLREALVDRGYDPGLASGIDLAIQHYGTTASYLAAVRDLAVDAARHVAGDLDEVPELAVDPEEVGDVTAADLLAEPVEPIAVSDSRTHKGAAKPPSESTPGAASASVANQDPSADVGGSDAAESTGPTATDIESATAETADVGEGTPDVEEDAPDGDEESPTETPAGAAETGSEPADTETAVGETEASQAAQPDESPGDFEPGEFDLDEDEREEIETEYGTEFQSASEVEEPGEADIETPAPEELEAETEPSEASAADQAPDTAAAGSDAETTTETAPTDETDEGAGDVDLEDAAVSAMAELDEGDGADRSAVVEAVVERHGADPVAVEDAIQDALMDGRCYEPDDATLKPI